MDYTKNNRIRPDKDFNKIAEVEFKNFFRQDGESIFTEMIKERNFNHAECIVIGDYLNRAVVNKFLGHYDRVSKTSYYNVALELFEKIINVKEINFAMKYAAKRHKLNPNEVEALIIWFASKASFYVTFATLKKRNI
ncbi:MAG TPA: hypothetical protein P5509_05000 [Bacteroidales bacterium]|nr:hypothetical protein [Bacteroidales bacterium]